MKLTQVLGKQTELYKMNSWQGPLVEIRQFDSLKGEQTIFLSKEVLEKLCEMLKESGK